MGCLVENIRFQIIFLNLYVRMKSEQICFNSDCRVFVLISLKTFDPDKLMLYDLLMAEIYRSQKARKNVHAK